MNKLLVSLTLPVTLAGLLVAGLLVPLEASTRLGPWPDPPTIKPASPAGVDVVLEEFVTGLDQPVQVTHAGDGSNRLFVVEQSGLVKVIAAGLVQEPPFLDITALVKTGSERGLLGLTFHPNYGTNGYFYVNYTRAGSGADEGDTVVARYSVSTGNPDLADPNSALEILVVDQPAFNHNGGQLLFGPDDGYLYIGLGDGGGSNDTFGNGQNIDTLLGAMLRIDVDNQAGGKNYAIPAGNPFVNRAGADEIWAIGLRNPWRFSFDRQTRDLYLGDVGQKDWEEISYQAANTAAGLNFGWPCREGAHAFNTTDPPCDDPALLATLVDPVTEYDHNLGLAVIGGFVYRGQLYPALVGHYFFADYDSGRLWSLYKTGPDIFSPREEELDTGLSISSFGEDEQGEVYVVDRGGTIYRLADANGPSPNLSSSTKTAANSSADPGQVVTYTILLRNSGALTEASLFLTDTLPTGLDYLSGSLAASHGQVNEALNPSLRWQGALTPHRQITVTYLVTATGAVTGLLTNQARLAGAGISPLTLTHGLLVPALGLEVIYLPAIFK